MKTFRNLILGAGLAGLAQVNGTVLACAACYGASDSPMAKGMNAGIFVLLGVIGAVLCGAATFFVFLARRASSVAKTQENLKS
jgi:hypothetical protein